MAACPLKGLVNFHNLWANNEYSTAYQSINVLDILITNQQLNTAS